MAKLVKQGGSRYLDLPPTSLAAILLLWPALSKAKLMPLFVNIR